MRTSGTTQRATPAGAKVDAGGSVLVSATDDTDNFVIVGSVAGGAVGVGGALTVLIVDKDTGASVGDYASVEARGGTLLTGISAGTMDGTGNFDRITTARTGGGRGIQRERVRRLGGGRRRVLRRRGRRGRGRSDRLGYHGHNRQQREDQPGGRQRHHGERRAVGQRLGAQRQQGVRFRGRCGRGHRRHRRRRQRRHPAQQHHRGDRQQRAGRGAQQRRRQRAGQPRDRHDCGQWRGRHRRAGGLGVGVEHRRCAGFELLDRAARCRRQQRGAAGRRLALGRYRDAGARFQPVRRGVGEYLRHQRPRLRNRRPGGVQEHRRQRHRRPARRRDLHRHQGRRRPLPARPHAGGRRRRHRDHARQDASHRRVPPLRRLDLRQLRLARREPDCRVQLLAAGVRGSGRRRQRPDRRRRAPAIDDRRQRGGRGEREQPERQDRPGAGGERCGGEGRHHRLHRQRLHHHRRRQRRRAGEGAYRVQRAGRDRFRPARWASAPAS